MLKIKESMYNNKVVKNIQEKKIKEKRKITIENIINQYKNKYKNGFEIISNISFPSATGCILSQLEDNSHIDDDYNEVLKKNNNFIIEEFIEEFALYSKSEFMNFLNNLEFKKFSTTDKLSIETGLPKDFHYYEIYMEDGGMCLLFCFENKRIYFYDFKDESNSNIGKKFSFDQIYSLAERCYSDYKSLVNNKFLYK